MKLEYFFDSRLSVIGSLRPYKEIRRVKMNDDKYRAHHVRLRQMCEVIARGTIYSWDMQNFDGLFILSHKHKIILQKFTESFLNAICTLSENIEFFNQEMVRPGNDRILMPKNE